MGFTAGIENHFHIQNSISAIHSVSRLKKKGNWGNHGPFEKVGEVDGGGGDRNSNSGHRTTNTTIPQDNLLSVEGSTAIARPGLWSPVTGVTANGRGLCHPVSIRMDSFISWFCRIASKTQEGSSGWPNCQEG